MKECGLPWPIGLFDILTNVLAFFSLTALASPFSYLLEIIKFFLYCNVVPDLLPRLHLIYMYPGYKLYPLESICVACRRL